MQKLILAVAILFVISFLSSCKSGAEIIDINDVEKNRTYQDSAIAKGKNPNEKLDIIKKLIAEYRSSDIENKEQNENYNYLLGRIYMNFKFLPFNEVIYDTVNKKMYNPTMYINYVDSSLYFSERAFQLNPKNVRTLYNICSLLKYEIFNYGYYSKEYAEMPFSSNRDPKRWSDRVLFIVQKAIDVEKHDTSSSYETSRYIKEFSTLVLTSSILNARRYLYIYI